MRLLIFNQLLIVNCSTVHLQDHIPSIGPNLAKGHVLERHFAVGAVDFAVVGKALPSFSVKFSTVV